MWWNKKNRSLKKGSSLGRMSSRDWTQIYSIYGIDDESQPFFFILFQALFFSMISLLLLLYFTPITNTLSTYPVFAYLPPGSTRFATGLVGSVTALVAVSLMYSAANFLYSAVPLRWEISQRMIASVSDWSAVKTALDLGCGRGILLNAVALQLKKHASSGRVVGLDQTRPVTMKALKTAGVEGVQEYVTCREGDVRRLPFRDDYFDVVVSAAAIRQVGSKEERERVVAEMVRVLKPGGVGVVWDLQHVPEYVKKLQELKMDNIIVSERVTAYMVSSQIVSFRKPNVNQVHIHIHKPHNMVGVGPTFYDYARQVRLDWRCHNSNLS